MRKQSKKPDMTDFDNPRISTQLLESSEARNEGRVTLKKIKQDFGTLNDFTTNLQKAGFDEINIDIKKGVLIIKIKLQKIK